jgi:cell division septal protein FtsQ
MFLKRKLTNRRLGREYVLDVKLRSGQVRKARLRLAAISLGVLFLLFFGLYVLWRSSEWGLTQLVFENSAFTIQQLDVKTDGVIAVGQLCRWAGLKPHENLFALDLTRVKRNLELISLIESVSVERVPPRMLRIRVIEREPIAQVNAIRPRSGGGGIETTVFQLDAEGYVMVPLEAGQRATLLAGTNETLPVISGIDQRELQPGRRLSGESVQAALRVILAFQESPMAGLADLKWIDITAPQILTVRTGQANEVTLGLVDLEQQLCRWRAVFDLGQKLGRVIATLDLAITNSIPLKWHDPESLPPTLPIPTKPMRVKKSHV